MPGAVRLTDTSTVCPGATLLGRFTDEGPPIWLPVLNTSAYEVVHVQLPMLFNRQVFVNTAPGAKFVPSDTVTSAMNCAQSQTDEAEAGCVVSAAAGMNESNMAASIMTAPADILDFMTFSLSFRLPALSLVEDV